MTAEAESGVRQLQAEDAEDAKDAGHHQKLEEATMDPAQSLRWNVALRAGTLTLDF